MIFGMLLSFRKKVQLSVSIAADTPHMASRALSGGSPRRLQPTPPAASNFYASAADGLHSYLPG
jgi:hypothetical protein